MSFKLSHEKEVFCFGSVLLQHRSARSSQSGVNFGSNAVLIFQPGFGQNLQVRSIDGRKYGRRFPTKDMQCNILGKGHHRRRGMSRL